MSSLSFFLIPFTLNISVMAVTDALQALRLLSERDENGEVNYDLVLSDVHMPVMDGFELLQHVYRDFNIPVVRKFPYIHNYSLN